MNKNVKKINIITLGCSKNTVDSEQLCAQLHKNGFQVAHNSDSPDFDIACVNTCGFINDAKEESIEQILNLVSAKKQGYLKKIIVFGCLSQRYFNELKTEIPEIDIIQGNYNITELINIICEKNIIKDKHSRIFDSPGHYAYLKISEGCSRTCAFCAIPLIKGKYQSRKIDDIINEAKYLSDKGVKELILIAQDLSYYGYDNYKQLMLPELVEKISGINGITWIRLHYLYPFMFPEKLIDIIASNPKLCKYIDIPLQHISDKMLLSMKRGGTKKQTINLLNKFREKIPDLAIRTSIMVGHPNETKKEFNELTKFIKEQKFDRLGVFKYSEEEGTYSAENYKDIISEEEKAERMDIIMKIQQEISLKKNAEKINKTLKVIIDSQEDGTYIGRTQHDSVEVDNEVIITSKEKLQTGNFYNVKVVDYDYYELFAEKC